RAPQNDAANELGPPDRHAYADRSSPILHDQSHISQFELLNELLNDQALLARRVAERSRRSREAESRIVQRDATERAVQASNQLPPLKRPGRVTVEKHERVATTHVDVVNARTAREIHELRVRAEHPARNFEAG